MIVRGFILATPQYSPWRGWGGAVSLWAGREQAQRVADSYNQMPSMGSLRPFTVEAAQLILTTTPERQPAPETNHG